MNRTIRFVSVLSIAAAAAVGVLALGSTSEAASAKTTKTVTMSCKNGWRGGAGGQYGGVDFSIDCTFDRNSVVIEGVDGSAYSIRMGSSNFGGAVDCFFSGDSTNVSEACGEVRITVR